MDARSFRDNWSRMAVVTARNKRDAELVKRVCQSDMGLPTWTCTQPQRFLSQRCGHWRKEMRSERRRVSSKSTKMPYVYGWIERPNTADYCCFTYTYCMSRRNFLGGKHLRVR